MWHKSSARNQARLRTFLRKVRLLHGLTRQQFAPLIGMKLTMYAEFEREVRGLGTSSVRSIAAKLSLGREVVAAMLDQSAPLVKLPPPASIVLPVPHDGNVVPEIMIDLETAAKMIGAISAAGRALPLGELLQLAH